jgi:hypothetical protein
MISTKKAPAEFQPYLYSYDIGNLRDRVAVRYSMPFRAYEALKHAQEITATKNAYIGGLAAVLGWAAPCVDLITFETVEDNNYSKTLCFWMIDPNESVETLKKQADIALEIWLGLALPMESFSQVQNKLQDGRFSSGGGCVPFLIDSALKSGGVCAKPKDNRMYSLLTLFAARQLENAVVNQGMVEEGELISTGPQNELYSGKSLLRYRPGQIERSTRSGLWTEVFTAVALNTPEQNNLRIAVNVSIRNFGEIKAAALSNQKSRYVDIFIPSDQVLTNNVQRMRCVELELKRSDYSNASFQSKEVSRERKILLKLLEMSGVRDVPEELGLNPLDINGFSLYPRLGANHGDRYALAGTGIPNPERENYLQLLDDRLIPAGFERVKFKDRPYKQAKSLKAIDSASALRNAVAIAAADMPGGFRLTHFVNGIKDEEIAKGALLELFGEPKQVTSVDTTSVELKYDDDFQFIYQKVDAGYLAEKTPKIDENKLVEIQSANKSKLWSAKQHLQKEAAQVAKTKISGQVSQYAPSVDTLWAALVEIPGFLQEEPARDPFLLNYAVLAEQGAVTQTKLIELEDVALDFDKNAIKIKRLKYENAICDLLRAAGISPLVTNQVRLAGWWILDRNDRFFDKRPGELDGLTTPIYADCVNGQLRVCILNDRDEVEWLSYSQALMRIAQRRVFDLSKLKRTEQTTRVEQFFAAVTPNDNVPTVIFSEATNIRRFIKGLSNDSLQFGTLSLGGVGGATAQREMQSGGAISLIRITNEQRKSPCYWVSERKQGVAKGFFQENGAESVFWLNRGLTDALQQGHSWANSVSRHEGEHSKKFAHRRFPTLSEVAVILKSEGMEADQLAGITRKAMQLHLATDEETLLPFPLHELSVIR